MRKIYGWLNWISGGKEHTALKNSWISRAEWLALVPSILLRGSLEEREREALHLIGSLFQNSASHPNQ